VSMSEMRYFVVAPCFNDNKSVQEICEELNLLPIAPTKIVILDDSRGVDEYDALPSNVQIICPSRRLGQQRLLVQFFRHQFAKSCLPQDSDLVVVMDSDGEDLPNDVMTLLTEYKCLPIVDLVLASRKSRQSTIKFKFGYNCFKFLSRLITGKTVQTGTFSVVSWRWLNQACYDNTFNISFVGGLIASPAARRLTPIARGPRRYGSPKVDLSGLIRHGLNIFFTMSNQIAVRFFIAFCFASSFTLFSTLGILILWWTGVTVPGYTSLILILIFQLNIIILMLFLGATQNIKLLDIQDPEVNFIEKVVVFQNSRKI